MIESNNHYTIEKLKELIDKHKTIITFDEVYKLFWEVYRTSQDLMLTKLYQPEYDDSEEITLKDIVQTEVIGSHNKDFIIDHFVNNTYLLKVISAFFDNEEMKKGLETKEDRLIFTLDQDLQFNQLIDALFNRIKKYIEEKSER